MLTENKIQVGSKLNYSDNDNFQQWIVTDKFDGGFEAKDDYETKDFFYNELQHGWSVSKF